MLPISTPNATVTLVNQPTPKPKQPLICSAPTVLHFPKCHINATVQDVAFGSVPSTV